MALYFCGETGCKGHHSFAATCSGTVAVVADYPALQPFIEAIGEEETQPMEPVEVETLPEKARGQSTPAIKAYNNKLNTALAPAWKQKAAQK
jgi:hypothetical protein